MYIQPPGMRFQPITVHKYKRKRVKRVKRNEVPPDYRKDNKAKLKKQMNELKWQFEHIRKEVKTWKLWNRISKLYKRVLTTASVSVRKRLLTRNMK